uniref:Sterol desaturase family protein n=1 Tax=Desulfatirhabdium butyrativorans TaxID=340467 RepID=A0A7C4W0W6_9BACT
MLMVFSMTSEAFLRLFCFGALFAVFGIWELLFPRRKRRFTRARRWTSNLGLALIDVLVLRILLPTAAVGIALQAHASGWGLFNNLSLPEPLEMVLAVVLLDLIVYLQHLMFHATPLLWRLHLVHHTDMDLDLTTGLRFHPIEILISMIIKMTAVAALGPSVFSVLAFEILLNGTAMFNHGNIALPASADRILRLFLVTPDMHRVHHSVTIRETNSNFGFNLPWWDRLFGTYRDQPVMDHETMPLGIAPFRKDTDLSLGNLLILPLKANPGAYSLNRIGADPKRLRNGRQNR